MLLEPVCCKKHQKCSWPVTALWNRGPLKIMNGIKLILDGQGNHLDLYIQYNHLEIFQVIQKSPIPQISNWSGPFFCCFSNKRSRLCHLQPSWLYYCAVVHCWGKQINLRIYDHRLNEWYIIHLTWKFELENFLRCIMEIGLNGRIS